MTQRRGTDGESRDPEWRERAERAERERTQLERVERERDRLRRENDRLKHELDLARRAAKRQAAPFSKGPPTPTPWRAGRRVGRRHGRHAHRPVPPAIDETYPAPLPAACPHCGGAVDKKRVASQYQEDVPVVQPVVRRFDVAVGRCRQCGRRVQGRHPLQTSDALGAAAAQVGPQAIALISVLNKHLGLSLSPVSAYETDCGY